MRWGSGRTRTQGKRPGSTGSRRRPPAGLGGSPRRAPGATAMAGGRLASGPSEGGAAAASQADILVVAPSLPCVSFTFSVCGSVKLSLYGSRVVIFKNLDLQGLCHPGVMKMPVRRPARLSCCSWRCRCCRERNSFRFVLSLRFGSGRARAFWGRPLSAFHTHTNVKVISYV